MHINFLLRIPLLIAFTATLFAVISEGLFGFAIYHPPHVGVWEDVVRKYYESQERPMIQLEPDCAQYDQELSYVLKPPGCNFAGWEFNTKVQVNSLKFRDDEESLHGPEVIVAGDSYTLGWGVEHEETFSSLLEKKLQRKVLNVGMSSYGTARELLSLRKVDRSNLRLLVIQHCDNDLEENESYIRHGGKLQIMSREKYEELKLHRDNFPYWFGKYTLSIARIVKWGWNSSSQTFSKDRAIRKANAFLDILSNPPISLDGVSIIMFEVNEWTRQDPFFLTALRTRIAQEAFPNYIEEMILVDLSDVLTLKDYFWYDTHLRAIGHQKLAIKIEEVVRESKNNIFASHP